MASTSTTSRKNSSSLSTPAVCYPPMTAVSNGILQGDIPFDFALPLLVVQIVLVLFVTRSMAALFRPFKQPRVLAEIIGGVLLGPTALGRNKLYMRTIFPPQSLPLLETIANIGLMFFIFMVGLGLDVQALKKTGKNALLIGLVGISVPFTASVGLAELLRRTISKGVPLAPLVVFMGCPISMSAFSVLVRILAELKMLNSDIAKLAVPSGAINDVAIYTLLAVGVATAGSSKSPLIPVWVLLCGAAYVTIMLTIVSRLMGIIAMKSIKEGPGRELCVCITLVAVLMAGFVSDAIGVHPFLGTFLLGLVIPKNTQFPKMMTEKIEDFVTGLLLPLFFASSGLKTNLAALHGASSIGFLVLFFATAATGKIVATFVTGKLIGLNTRAALVLGFLMNTKGLAVLIVLNIGRDLKVLTDEIFAILVLTCLLTSFVTTPTVTALCKQDVESVSSGNMPERSVEGVETAMKVGDRRKKKQGLRVVACAYEPSHHLAFANFLEAARGGTASTCSLKIYALKLLQFSDCPSALVDLTTNPNQNPNRQTVSFAFPLSPLLHKPSLRTISLLTKLDSMDEDICKLASKKHASLILLPYYRSSNDPFYFASHKINQKVLDHAPCSVGIFVDQASLEIAPSFFAFNAFNVMVLFFGGPDDREALSIASRMINHPGVVLKVVRIIPSCAQHNDIVGQAQKTSHLQDNELYDPSQEEVLDDDAISSIKTRALESSFVYSEISFQGDGQTLVKDIESITKDVDINLFIVGRGPKLSLEMEILCPSQSSALGVVGDVLVSMEHISRSCILVVQQNPR